MAEYPLDTVSKQPQRSLSQHLTYKLIFMVAFIFTVTTLGTYGLFSYKSKKQYNQKASEYLAYLRDSLRVPLWNIDREWIESICGSFAKNETVALLRVTGENGEPLFETALAHENSLITRTTEVHHKGHMIGTVALGLTTRIYEKSNQQILAGSILTMVLVILGLAFFTRMILKSILERPMAHLMKRIDQISSGKYHDRPEPFDHIEITTILDKFNYMADEVKNREDSLIETNLKLESEISDRIEAEKALSGSEKRYRQLVDNLPVGLFRSSPQAEGPFLMINPSLAKMFGYPSAEQLVRKSVKHLYREPEMRRHVLDILASERSVQGLEVAFKKRDGSPLVGLLTAHMAKDLRGRPLHIDGMIEDITERKQLEAQIRQIQKMEAIGTLAGGIAHDFNNILSSIFGFAEAAKLRHAGSAKIDEYLDEILSSGLRARSLIKQIMAFSRQSEVTKVATTIAPILKETVKFLRASLPAMIDIRLDIRMADAVVWADPTQIHQIFMNLCTNAAHSMKSDGGSIEVRLDEIMIEDKPGMLRGEPGPGDYIRLSVSDDGEGIRKAHIERIFEPFFTTKQRGEGTGMGLAVTHGIIEDMGGTISVTSEPGEGSTFRVLLPVYEGEVAEPGHRIAKPRPGKGTILFVDDEEGFLASGKAILEQIGYILVTAASGPEALALFESDPAKFDLVLTDLVMPKMTGLELARRLTRIRPDIIIILCTGFSDNIMDIGWRDRGIYDIVMKPLLAGELTKAIEKSLQSKGK